MSKLDWCFDIEKAKGVKTPEGFCLALLKSGWIYSPCSYDAAGVIGEDEVWLVWNRPTPEFFDEIKEPEAYCYIEIPKRDCENDEP